MGGYVKTGPFVNDSAPGISSAFLNAVESVLARGSGDTETGKYWLAAGTYAVNAAVSQYMSSTSRTSVPVSVTIDTADNAASNFAAPSTSHLGANGFQVFTTGTGTNVSCNVAGNTTINY